MNMLFKQSFLSSFSHTPKIVPLSPKPEIYEVNFLRLGAWRESLSDQTHHPPWHFLYNGTSQYRQRNLQESGTGPTLAEASDK